MKARACLPDTKLTLGAEHSPSQLQFFFLCFCACNTHAEKACSPSLLQTTCRLSQSAEIYRRALGEIPNSRLTAIPRPCVLWVLCTLKIIALSRKTRLCCSSRWQHRITNGGAGLVSPGHPPPTSAFMGGLVAIGGFLHPSAVVEV